MSKRLVEFDHGRNTDENHQLEARIRCGVDDGEILSFRDCNPIDFSVEPNHPHSGFMAKLSCRNINCFGVTEHDAIRALINRIAELCTSGCMDDTGCAMPAFPTSERYEAVYGKR